MKVNYIFLIFMLFYWSCTNHSSEKLENKKIVMKESQEELKNKLNPDITTERLSAVNDSMEKIKQGPRFSNGTITSTNIKDIECSQCDIEIVLKLDEQIDSVSYNLLYQFLCTFDHSCLNNLEYSQFSNEILYETLKKHPGAIIEIISKHPELNREYIYKEISSPLLDYDYNSIIKSLKSLDLNSNDEEVKIQVIKSLEDAMIG